MRFLVLSFLIWPSDASSAWLATGNRLFGEGGAVTLVDDYLISDGGVIAVGYSSHVGLRYLPLALRTAADGSPAWSGRLALTSFQVQHVAFCSDGGDGFLVSYSQSPAVVGGEPGPVEIQRFDADGQAVWGPSGFRPWGDAWSGKHAEITSVGDGGAYVRWFETTPEGESVTKIRRLSPNGSWAWTEPTQIAGLDPTDTIHLEYGDDDHGYTVVWKGPGVPTVYGARVALDGTLPWTGTRALNHSPSVWPNSDLEVKAFPGRYGDFFFVYTLAYIGVRDSRYLQRVDATGSPVWLGRGYNLTDHSGDVSGNAVEPLEDGGVAVGIVNHIDHWSAIWEFDADGFRRKVLTLGRGNEAGDPRALASDGTGGYYVCHGSRLQHWDATGRQTIRRTGIPIPWATTDQRLDWAADGELYTSWLGVQNVPHAIKPFQSFIICYPVATQVWNGDSVRELGWVSPGYESVDIDVSYESNNNWIPVARNISDRGRFQWAFPNIARNSVHFRVTPTGFPELARSTQGMRIRPRAGNYGKPSGELFLSFSESERVAWADIEPLVPFEFYLRTRLDPAVWSTGPNGEEQGISAWEASVVLPEGVVALERSLVDPRAVNFASSGLDEWIVGTGHPIGVGEEPVTLLRYRAILLQPDSRDLPIGIAGVSQTSFADTGGPGRVPGWSPVQPTGECSQGCLRMFDLAWAQGFLLMRPTANYVQDVLVHVDDVETQPGHAFTTTLAPSLLDLGPLVEPQSIGVFDFELSWDPTLVQIDEIRPIEASLEAVTSIEFHSGGARLIVSPAQPLPRQSLASLAFTVSGSTHAGEGSTTILISSSTSKDGEGRDLAVTLDHGEVHSLCPEPDCTPISTAVSDFGAVREGNSVALRWFAPTLPRERLELRGSSSGVEWSVALDTSEPGYFEAIDHPPVAIGRVAYELLLRGSQDSSSIVARTELELVEQRLTFSLHPSTMLAGSSGARVAFTLDRRRSVELSVYGVNGRRVRRIVSEELEGGLHELVWPGEDENGRSVAAGVYYVRLQSEGEIRTGKIALTR